MVESDPETLSIREKIFFISEPSPMIFGKP